MTTMSPLIGRCIGCRHSFTEGPCGGCGARPGPGEAQCPGVDECTDNCALCASGDWNLICDDCRFYAAQDGITE